MRASDLEDAGLLAVRSDAGRARKDAAGQPADGGAAAPTVFGSIQPGRVEPGAAPQRRPGPKHRLAQGFDAVSAWLPILLMFLMALGSWWLVKNTPQLDRPRAAAAPRHEPDSTMDTFLVQRFAPDGPLRVEIRGQRMRHYPDDDTYEIDDARIRSIAPDGQELVATARRAVANRDASEVQLSGGAHVVHEATATEPAIDFRGEFLDIVQPTEELRSHLPVVVTQGGNEMHADAMHYDHLRRQLDLRGHVRAVLTPSGKPGAPAPTGPR